MGIPKNDYEREEVLLVLTDDVRDFEVDETDPQDPRISWEVGDGLPTWVAHVDADGFPYAGQRVIEVAHGFRNGAEWGTIDAQGGAVQGLYFTLRDPILEADEIWQVDPSSQSSLAGRRLVRSIPEASCFMFLAWNAVRGPGGDLLPLLLYLRSRYSDPADLVNPSMWVLDPTGAFLPNEPENEILVPNFSLVSVSTASANIRPVKDQPAVVFTRSWGASGRWQLAWQRVTADGEPHQSFGPDYYAVQYKVVSAGVRKIQNPPIWLTSSYDAYFLYVIKRKQGDLVIDSIDYCLVEYDGFRPMEIYWNSIEVPGMVGPGGLEYKYVTDDEPYTIPDDPNGSGGGGPCIILNIATEPAGDLGTFEVPGVIALILCELTETPDTTIPSFHLLTPPDDPEAPRKDGEGLTVYQDGIPTAVYVFNRRPEPVDGDDNPPWKGYRTLAWSAGL